MVEDVVAHILSQLVGLAISPFGECAVLLPVKYDPAEEVVVLELLEALEHEDISETLELGCRCGVELFHELAVPVDAGEPFLLAAFQRTRIADRCFSSHQ